MSSDTITLSSLRRMFEGVIPATMCSISSDGVPHLCYLSQVEYVDEQHVALSFQFFNQSRQNILATRRCAVTVDDPYTAAGVRLQLHYLRTEDSGPIFERMKAKLAGIAAHCGMDKIYHLRGADIYRVVSLEMIPGRKTLQAPAPRCDIRAGIRAVIDRLSACDDTVSLLNGTLTAMSEHLRIDHSMILLVDAARACLRTVASLGYDTPGLGSEIPLGQGVAGIAAREGVPIRIGHMAMVQTYTRAIRLRNENVGLGNGLREEAPLPGLADPRSQLAVPLKIMGRTIGVLLVESTQNQHFSHDDEDALVSIAAPLALGLSLMPPSPAERRETVAPPLVTATVPEPSDNTPLLTVSHHAYTHSVFLDQEYLIKGVAGAILWRLLCCWQHEGRQDFSNRELRLDTSLGLPDVTDNLGVRLILLQKRLAERQVPIQIVKTGRGRFRLVVQARLQLIEQS